jgi:hypothetical protein
MWSQYEVEFRCLAKAGSELTNIFQLTVLNFNFKLIVILSETRF